MRIILQDILSSLAERETAAGLLQRSYPEKYIKIKQLPSYRGGSNPNAYMSRL
jgi:hypothetical protein